MQQSVDNPKEFIYSPLGGGGKVLCFGELLLRLCPDVNSAWLRQNNISVYVAGAEANAAADLALWGIPVSYLTVLPDNFLSKELLDYFKSKKIDATNILLKHIFFPIFSRSISMMLPG